MAGWEGVDYNTLPLESHVTQSNKNISICRRFKRNFGGQTVVPPPVTFGTIYPVTFACYSNTA